MKLYTEEQVMRAIHLAHSTNAMDEVIADLTPIELPNDEEIEKQSIGNATFAPSFVYGAKWMRDKILNK